MESRRLGQLLEAILENPDEIEQVTPDSGEYYFSFRGHAFSLMRRSSAGPQNAKFGFYIYPDWEDSVAALVAEVTDDPDGVRMAIFSEREHPLLRDSFGELYEVLAELDLNIGDLLDEILGPDDNF